MRSILFVLLVGCTTTKSYTVGPFVRDIQGAPGGINVISCAVGYTVEHTYYGFGANNNEKSEALHEGACVQQVVPTEVSR